MSTVPMLVEQASAEVRDMLRKQFNANLALVYAQAGDATINLDKVPDSNYYFSEAVDPMRPPAIFIVADRSDHDLNFQNAVVQKHIMLVAALVEDVEQQRLTKKVWRYAQAIHATLHDQGTAHLQVLVTSIDYGAIGVMRTREGGRAFRKSATARCEILHAEMF